jgi:hypothetical protein
VRGAALTGLVRLRRLGRWPTWYPRLFIAQADDLIILRDGSETHNLEPWFPEEEQYTAFDSEGRRFELTVEATEERRRLLPGRRTVRTVVCRPLETAPTGDADLVAVLRRHLGQSADAASLGDLVAMIVQQDGYSWRSRRS